MSAPRTLRELRAAVARVLVARGEAADALRVDCVDRRGGRYPADMRWFAEIGGNYCGTRPFMLAFGRGADEASACDAAWRSFAEQREAAVVAAQAALAAAQDEVLRARAALDAADAAWLATQPREWL